MRKLKRLARKNKKLLLRILAFGVAFEVVLLASLLIDIPRYSQEWMKTTEIGLVQEDETASQGDLEDETATNDEAMLYEDGELTGAGLDDSMFVDPINPEEGTDLALEGEILPGPEPYDFGDGSDSSYGDFAPDYAEMDDGSGGSYNDWYPADNGGDSTGAGFDDYGDTAGCDGDCDDYTIPPSEDPVAPTAAPVITENPAPTQAAPTSPAATKAPTKPPTAAPTAAPTKPAPQPTPTTPPSQPTQPPKPSVSGGLVAVPASDAPKLDGQGSDAAWASAPEFVIETSGGANDSAARVSLRAVYDNQRVYFLVTWEDPTNSWLRNPWEKQSDGSWKLLAGSENKGSDENQYYEDKLALLWPVNDSIPGFATEGCGTACHLGEGGDEKQLGTMHTEDRRQLADLWNWKAYRNIGQIDDLYLNNNDYKDDFWAGFQTDPSDGGGYHSNSDEDGNIPEYMLPGGGLRDGSPGFIYAPDAVALDNSLFQPGDRLPSVIAEPFLGDRGDITAGWTYVDGRWTMEFSRALVTGSRYDVQFDDLSKVYYFGLATFDNTQIRHAAQAGATPFRFQR